MCLPAIAAICSPPLHWQICLSSSPSRSHRFLHSGTYSHRRNRGYQRISISKRPVHHAQKYSQGVLTCSAMIMWIPTAGAGGCLINNARPAAGRSPIPTNRQTRFLHALPGFYCPRALSASPRVSAAFDAPAFTCARSVNFSVSIAICSAFRDRSSAVDAPIW